MAFKGEVLTVSELLVLSGATLPGVHPPVGALAKDATSVRHTAAGNARHCSDLIEGGEPLDVGWRFGILQTLDDYVSTVRRGGVELGAEVFAEEPPQTGSPELDAAFAALADHLAERDGWEAPSWVENAERAVESWYPEVPSIFREEAEAESPRAFRQRGLFITERSLARA